MNETKDINQFIAERLQPMTKMILQIKYRPNNLVLIGLPIGAIVGYGIYAIKIAFTLFIIAQMGFWFGSLFLMFFNTLWTIIAKRHMVEDELAFLEKGGKL